MKKYIYRLCVALFAVSSFTLVACSDDDDPNNGGGNGNNGDYVLYVDDEATYPSAYESFLEETTGRTTYPAFGVSNDGLKVEAACYRLFNSPSDYLEYIASSEYNHLGDVLLADINFYIKAFDPATATKGQEVEFIEGAFINGELSVRKYEQTTNPTYVPTTYFNKIKSGKITFESYTTNAEGTPLIVYRFDNVIVSYGRDVNDVDNPQSEIKLDGLILTKYETYVN
ncbi:hypothetical protein Bacsa_0933 [Phocaeicola salanitronis DSM 18170]|uniref:Lipoprotein n=1 Tax=Phocaeicola salanitronis (strain DSM 18170 / JCM 13657 / CCUG 60908 / BL78) TaxID=667015 RepID=F0R3B5_PHOSB|nr:hypothetical protein [Phocaeicola salanitronis]ADY35524.1 hypothetical protein Bacsa_0933 [Phocaeicola salanitronis DSM 18170]